MGALTAAACFHDENVKVIIVSTPKAKVQGSASWSSFVIRSAQGDSLTFQVREIAPEANIT